jgi:hypothetical protein
VAVYMADFNVARTSAETAYSFARRRVGIGAVPQCTISYLTGFLAPLSTTLTGWGQSSTYSTVSSESSASSSASLSSVSSTSSPFNISSIS